jgi:hypothetical protein
MAWEITGNSGTNPTVDFVGTIDNHPLVVRTNNIERLRIDTAGNLGIGAPLPQSKLQINGLTAIDEGPTAAGAWTNLGSNSYYNGAWKRLDTTKAGVNLHMNADDRVGQECGFTGKKQTAPTPETSRFLEARQAIY